MCIAPKPCGNVFRLLYRDPLPRFPIRFFKPLDSSGAFVSSDLGGVRVLILGRVEVCAQAKFRAVGPAELERVGP